MPQSLLAAAFGFLPRLFHSLPSHSTLINARRGFRTRSDFPDGLFWADGETESVWRLKRMDGWEEVIQSFFALCAETVCVL
ncbi:uncharacterized protein IWZ02DRAFT_92428 [Phyllosticta citriasiana]|uniref:Uncharacterized protein n=1 Tax=Phyllosticta citriasiana TaxID=595635 RepID=A0ABR1L2F0_9PEZI